MKIALLSPITWRTPPRGYGPWERSVATLCEALVARGQDVTLFATGDSQTAGRLQSVCPVPLGEHPDMSPLPWKALHIAHLMAQAGNFDIIHNNLDFLPLTYTPFIRTPMVTTDHGFSHPDNVRVFETYNTPGNYYVAISRASRHPRLRYSAVIPHGIDTDRYRLGNGAGGYLLFFGRIDHQKGAREAIAVARQSGRRLLIAGLINDQAYFDAYVAPALGDDIRYIGNVGPDKHAALLGEASALLHLIHFDEPFGLSVAEAMACGTPVIAMKRGSMPELIHHGRTGFLVHSTDEAVAAVHHLPALNRHDCRRHITANFSIDSMVSAYLQLYEDIVQQRRRAPTAAVAADLVQP